jgi:bifunctional dethiobiotin synthetase / adenosylmethionine---8-amino-7-oxononanoate aminotransferase
MLRKRNFRSGSFRQLGNEIKDVFTGHCRLMSTSNLQVMIFGSSTGVGKTIVSAGICRAALARERKVCYIKPLQTGELDEYFVNFYTNPQGICDIFLRTLHHWSSSMPPHLAAAAEANPISDKDLVVGLEREMRAFSNGAAAQVGTKQPQLFTVIETAGGVLSPGPSRNLQADIYRTFRFPIILVGDSKLGGITTTLSAYESLRLRGYTVHAIVMIEHPGTNKYGNVVMIREHLQRSLSSTPMSHTTGNSEYNNIPPWAVNSVPKVFRMFPLPSDKLLHHWFKENADEFTDLFDHIEAAVEEEKKRLLNMRKVGQENIWWPFTQHASVGDDNVTFIESAHGDKFRVITPVADASEAGLAPEEISTKDRSEINVVASDLFDGCGSWWTQVTYSTLAISHFNYWKQKQVQNQLETSFILFLLH